MNTTTASTQYDQHRAAILDLLDQLRDDLALHNINFDRTDRRHWGFPGDLAHVEELLTEVHNFLNNEE